MRVARVTLLLAATLGASSAAGFTWPSRTERIEKALAGEDVARRREAATELSGLPPAIAKRLVPIALADPDDDVRVSAAAAAVEHRMTGVGDTVIPWLSDGEVGVRLAAAGLLALDPSPNAVTALGRTLADASAEVRQAASLALGRSGSADAVVPLLGRLDDPSQEVRESVVRALAELGDPRAVVPLIGKIQDSRPSVREAVAHALGELGDARAAPALLLTLRDTSSGVRIAALLALGRTGDASSALAIASIARDVGNSPVSAAAFDALATLGTEQALDVLFDAVGSPDSAVRANAAAALGRLGVKARSRVERCLEGQPSRTLAHACTDAIAALGPDARVEPVVAALRRGVIDAIPAMRAIAKIGDATGLSAVLEHLGDRDALVREAAIASGAELLHPEEPDGRAVEPVLRALEAARTRRGERVLLVRLLGRTGSPRGARVLGELAAIESDLELRLAAIEALGFVGSGGLDSLLLDALDSEIGSVRLAAALALRRSGSPASATDLLNRLERAAEQDRQAIVLALAGPLVDSDARIFERATARLLRTRGPERDAMIEALGRSPRAVATLARLARSSSSVADRAKIAESLGPHQAASALLRDLAKDPDGSVRANAIWSLGRASGPEHEKLFEEALLDRDVAVAANAAAALGRSMAPSSSDRAVAALCSALGDPRPAVRSSSLSALGVAGKRCGDGEVERKLLARDGSANVRRAAASLVSRAGVADLDRRALERCVTTDRDGAVAAACAERRTQRSSGTRPTTIYVVPAGESVPVPRAPFALVRADGLVRYGSSDRRGAVYESDAPRGDVALGIPAPLIR